MELVSSPTEFCQRADIPYEKGEGMSVFIDIENAIEAIKESSEETDNYCNVGDALLFETIEDGEDVEYMANDSGIYRRS